MYIYIYIYYVVFDFVSKSSVPQARSSPQALICLAFRARLRPQASISLACPSINTDKQLADIAGQLADN